MTGSGTLALTNTLGGKETEIAIQGRKTWVGDGADDRPNSITLSLLQNGTKVAEREVTPNADGSWTYDFGSWPPTTTVAGRTPTLCRRSRWMATAAGWTDGTSSTERGT